MSRARLRGLIPNKTSATGNTDWQAYTPTINWITATPASYTVQAMYREMGKTLCLLINITITDSNANAGFDVSLPIPPKPNNINPPFTGTRRGSITGSGTSVVGVVVDSGSSNIGSFRYAALADGSNYLFSLSAEYPV